MKKVVKVIAIVAVAASMSVIPAASFAKPAPKKQEMQKGGGKSGNGKKAPGRSDNKARGGNGGKMNGTRNDNRAGVRGGNPNVKGRASGPAAGPRTPGGAHTPNANAAPGPKGRVAPGQQGPAAPGPKGRVAPGPQGPAAPGPQGRVAPGPQGPAAPGPNGPAPHAPAPAPVPPAPAPAPAPVPVAPAPAPAPAPAGGSTTVIIEKSSPTGLFGKIGNLIDDGKSIHDDIKYGGY